MLGDYIDRGFKIREVVDYIIRLIESGYNVTPLTGNHEQMLLGSYDDPGMLPLWFYNEGQTTLESFGINDVRNLGWKYLQFFRSLKFYERVGDFYFVHGGFNDRIEDPFSDLETMIWESRPVYENPVFRGKTIIHGHRPKILEYTQEMVKTKAQVIPIDTGCVYGREAGYGYLTALDTGNMNLISVPLAD